MNTMGPQIQFLKACKILVSLHTLVGCAIYGLPLCEIYMYCFRIIKSDESSEDSDTDVAVPECKKPR